MPAKKRGPKVVTEQHKAAMAQGRRESNAVRNYLEALEATRPKRGRKRTVESIEKRLAALPGELEEADALSRLKLIQERMDLEEELVTMEGGTDVTELEDEFVEVAASYSDRQGITYAAWRELGVEAAVLKRAGIGRARG